MKGETVLDELKQNTATFIATMCYRNMADMEEDVLNHEGNVVLTSKHKQTGKHGIWRALHETVTEPGTEILLVSPNPPGARGAILLIEDELERAPFAQEVWGVERTSKTEINFDNGSRIISHHVGDEDGNNRIRGYKPDLLVVDNWAEEGYEISEQTKEEVLLPMLMGDTDLWINDVQVSNDALTQAAISEGAYVKQMDR
jgi:hypothetical protein